MTGFPPSDELDFNTPRIFSWTLPGKLAPFGRGNLEAFFRKPLLFRVMLSLGSSIPSSESPLPNSMPSSSLSEM